MRYGIWHVAGCAPKLVAHHNVVLVCLCSSPSRMLLWNGKKKQVSNAVLLSEHPGRNGDTGEALGGGSCLPSTRSLPVMEDD